MIHYCELMEWKKLHCMKEDFWDFEEGEWKYFHEEMMDKISFKDGTMQDVYIIGRGAITQIINANICWERWPDKMKEVCKVEKIPEAYYVGLDGYQEAKYQQMVKVVGHAVNKKKKEYEDFVKKYGVRSEYDKKEDEESFNEEHVEEPGMDEEEYENKKKAFKAKYGKYWF